jgi:pilus assembly protein FimV
MHHSPALTQHPPARQARWRWLLTATLLVMGVLSGFSAQALSLGRLQVQSSQGESLRAELELTDVSVADANSLRVAVAPAATFRSMGIDYQSALSEIAFNLQLLPEGRAVLKITGGRPVTVSFLELVLEISWASGRITRDFTLLIMPSGTQAPVLPVAPAVQQAPASAPAAELTPPPVTAQTPTPTVTAPAPATPASAPAAPKPAEVAATGGARLKVKAGDTASELAVQAKSVNVSLDQMLLAMLNSNPEAFVANNVNRLLAGAEISMPSADQAQALDPVEARKSILLQSQDFDAYRQQLANKAKEANVAPAGRTASGKVQSALKDTSPGAAAADKLTLSKGGVQAGGSAEEKLSQERKAKDDAQRVAELSKNIKDLSDLGTKSLPATAAAGSPAPAAVIAPAATDASLPAVNLPAPPAMGEDKPNLIDRLSKDDAVLPAAGVFLSLLLVWVLLRLRRNRPAKEVQQNFDAPSFDMTAEEAATYVRVNEQSFISNAEKAATPLPPEDPLYKARKELEAGRDMVAEALLRTALDKTPKRIDIMLELMDLCVQNEDSVGFEALAVRALGAMGGPGPEWPEICIKGQSLDPTNPLYGPTRPVPQTSPFPKLDFDLELPPGTSPGVVAANEPAVRNADISMASPAPLAKSNAPAADFDMNSISLDLQPPEGAGDKPPPKAS